MEGKLKLTPCVGCVGKLVAEDAGELEGWGCGDVRRLFLGAPGRGMRPGSLARNHFVWREFQFV